MSIEGYFAPEFAPVAEAFAQILQQPEQRGAALCVQIAGDTVIDIWGGIQDRVGQQPWQRDTLVNVFSCGKPLLAVVILQLVQEGKLQLDAPMADYWPEFAVLGKETITVRQLLSHQAGLPAIEQQLPAEALYDWSAMTEALEQQQPWWPPGTAHGYAPMTYGWLLGELIQRVDGRSAGKAIAQRISEPLGLGFYVGVPDSDLARISDTSRIKGAQGDTQAQRLLQAIMQPQSMTSRAFANPPSILNSSNKPEWRKLEQPAATGHSDARALAGFYMALLQGRLLDAELLEQMQQEHAYGADKTLLTTTRFGLGCMLEQADNASASYALGAQAFGHPGAGGSLGCADPELELSMAFVTNSLDLYVLTDPRAQWLNKQIKRCL